MPVLTAVAYARYSSDKQQESSITVQLAGIKKFCAVHNIQLIREYVDEAQSGTTSNRKQFQQMILDARERQFQLVIIHRMDRLARNVEDARYYKKYLKRYGVKIVSAIEEFDESPEGEFFELISMGVAELYSKKLAREAAAGKLANAREGKAHGGTPLLGYKVRNKYYVIEEKEAEAVRIIFDMVVQGYGYTYIRDFLNANGYRRADGRLFTAHFYDILRNRKYIGEYVYNRATPKDENGKRNNHSNKDDKDIIRIKGAIPKIIDEDVFYKVQKILDNRRQHHGFSKKINTRYLLSGLLRCAECGRAICGANSWTKGVLYHIYRCGAKGRVCTTKLINSSYLDDYIHTLLLDSLFSECNREKLCLLIMNCYITAYDNLRNKRLKLQCSVHDAKDRMKVLEEQLTNDESKHLRSFTAGEMDRLAVCIKDLEFDIEIIDREIAAFPEYNPKKIIQIAHEITTELKSKQFDILQKVYRRMINVIKINNQTIETTLNFNVLLNSDSAITCTVIEKRDYVARPENHYLISYAFATLTVRVN